MRTKVMLIDANSSRASLLRKALEEFEYEISIQLADTQNLCEKVRHVKPDVLVLGTDFPDDLTLEELANLNLSAPQPVVMFAEKDTPQIIKRTMKAGVSAFIVDDIQAHRIPSIINIAMARFKESQKVIGELEKTKSKLAERKILEKAKGLLMEQKGITEDEAYAFLRKMAMDKGLKIGAVAENIVDVMGMLQGGAQA